LGDALLAHFPALAHIAATAGRDGAIDAWVESNARASGQFDNFLFPLIVECKHHDEELANTAHNIKQGWTKVREKLIKQAQDGWPKLYAPWQQARAYLYCISARFPNQQAREDLLKEIRDFFSGLPTGQRPPIAPDQIRVWDWSDLQAWLNQKTILCDHWLGIELAQWIDHLSLRERLSKTARSNRQTFQAYLLEEYLPFVPPADNDPVHPERLLRSLTEHENLLLIGEGGIGKTRTMQEVAQLAQDKGWRVLHLLPSEHEVDLSTAAEVLLRPAQDTLVLIDYIDQLAHFDARYWHSTLLPEAQRRGTRLHLLTNARPSGSSESLQHLEESGLFRSITMTRNAGHRERVATAMEDRLCPTAIAQIGRQTVKKLCGNRPIIAMFIAQELEKLALAAALVNQQHDIPRPDDLLGWIRKRLREAELLPAATPRSSRWQAPPPPAPELVAVAAALAVCPFPIEELPDVVRATLTVLHGTVENTNRIIEMLEKDGWIEADSNRFFHTPHDAIPDEVLREILDHPNGMLPVLLSSVHLGRPLGRFARSLGRLSGIASLSPTQKSGIEDAATRWLKDNDATLGQALRQNQPDVVAYALGALFDYRPWHLAAQTSWNELIAPWLSSHGDLPAARHLLHRGLRSLPDNTLLQPALTWLESNCTLRTASYILAPLLNWDAERLDGQQKAVLTAAISWLENTNNVTAVEAGFVLAPLLSWDVARLGDRENAALTAAVRWLANPKNVTLPGAKFVLDPLLSWDAARLGDHERCVLTSAIRWLEHPNNGTTLEAQFVLHPLLNWDAKRVGDQQENALNMALRWLEHANNIISPKAAFVLNPLLSWDATRIGDQQKKTIIIAMRWLEQRSNATATEAAFVLNPLLSLDATRLGDQQKNALTAAIRWLEHPGNATAAGQFILHPLLAWEAIRLGDQQNAVLSAAIRWVEHSNNIGASDTGFVLGPLLRWDAVRLGDQQKTALAAAIRWLERPNNVTSPDAGFILPPLLKWELLPAEKRRKYALLAIGWLDHHAGRNDVTHCLKSLLQVANRFPDELEIKPVLMYAARWLDRNADHPERGYVIGRLLRVKGLAPRLCEPLAKAGVDFLDKKHAAPSDHYLLSSIMAHLPAHPALSSQWTALAVRWIACANNGATISLFDSCRKFLTQTCLDVVRPNLVAAYQQRPDWPEYDWTRPLESINRERPLRPD
jgi:hypothetical protein